MKSKRLLPLIGIICLTGVLVGIPYLTSYSPEARAEIIRNFKSGRYYV